METGAKLEIMIFKFFLPYNLVLIPFADTGRSLIRMGINYLEDSQPLCNVTLLLGRSVSRYYNWASCLITLPFRQHSFL